MKVGNMQTLYLRLRGLPFSATIEDVRNFFRGLDVIEIAFLYDDNGRPSGECYCKFSNQADLDAAFLKDREKIGKRYVEIFHVNELELSIFEKKIRHFPLLTNPNAGYVCVVGIPFKSTEEDIARFFNGYNVEEVIIGKEPGERGRPTGEAYVRFGSKQEAQKALNLTGQHMGNRYLVLSPTTVHHYNAFKDKVNGILRPINNMYMDSPYHSGWIQPERMDPGFHNHTMMPTNSINGRRYSPYDRFGTHPLLHRDLCSRYAGASPPYSAGRTEAFNSNNRYHDPHRMPIKQTGSDQYYAPLFENPRFVELDSRFAHTNQDRFNNMEHPRLRNQVKVWDNAAQPMNEYDAFHRNYSDYYFHCPPEEYDLRCRDTYYQHGYGPLGGPNEHYYESRSNPFYEKPVDLFTNEEPRPYGRIRNSEFPLAPNKLHMRGLPFHVTGSEIEDFFAPLNCVEIKVGFYENGRSTGDGFVEFESPQDTEVALKKDHQNLGKRYIELFSSRDMRRSFANITYGVFYKTIGGKVYKGY